MKHLIYLGTLVVLATTGCKKSGEYVDQPVAMEITCIHNLKQIGLEFRIWEGDHKDQPPFLVSTNDGGVMELVTAKDGFRQNPNLIFQVMSNELQTPLLLVCPQDKSKTIAKDWESLSTAHVSYVFPASSSSNVLMVCPVDGNILFEDGTVLEKSTGRQSLKL